MRPMRWLLLIFLIISAVEMGLFIWVGSLIGPLWVVILIFSTSILGITIAKQQGMETLHRARQAMGYGQVPTEQLINGVCIFIGGILLFIPGFLTDIIGFIFVLPWTRNLLQGYLLRLLKYFIEKNTIIYRR